MRSYSCLLSEGFSVCQVSIEMEGKENVTAQAFERDTGLVTSLHTHARSHTNTQYFTLIYLLLLSLTDPHFLLLSTFEHYRPHSLKLCNYNDVGILMTLCNNTANNNTNIYTITTNNNHK